MRTKYLIILTCLLIISCKKEGRVVDGDFEPPAPYFWEAYDDESVEGVDADNDGLRDDIERKINELVDTPNRRKAFKQYFKTLYEALKYATQLGGMSKSKQRYRDASYDHSCLSYFYEFRGKDWDSFNQIEDDIKDLFKNSKVREENYKKYDKNLSGDVYTVHPDSIKNCRFEITNN